MGLRDVERGLKANPDTAYRLASCSKILTSATLGVLVDEGIISWGDLIKKRLPEFNPSEDPWIGAEGKILDACRHSTGLGNPNTAVNGPQGNIVSSGKDYVHLMNACPTSSEHGQRFRSWCFYSNIAYGLMANLAEAATGSNFVEISKTKVLEPLGLRQTLILQDDYAKNENMETHPALLACMGIASSVNDMLAFCAAVMNRYDEEKGRPSEERKPVPGQLQKNPLRQVAASWDIYWTRPMEDGFENDTAYAMGWYETTMPSGALGLLSYSHRRYLNVKDSVVPYIIGKESPRREVHGHNGITNGATATVYVLPNSHSAVVAFSNAAETAAQILLQALFDMTPKGDLLVPLREEIDRTLNKHVDINREWRKNRDVSVPQFCASEYAGTYIGLGISRMDIEASETSPSGLAVVFGEKIASKYELEPYNVDAFSFLPMDHKEVLARGMIDGDYYTVGILRFMGKSEDARPHPDGGANGKTPVVGLNWQWDQWEKPSFYSKA
ncbi:hypothetical protein LTR70_005185 [Exophiala xenobiotica]|uniref:Beta-lactamase-related domain-containing protein n=1 Tax=Lithohypha guttulata TaxID=1690604 RepID=A0ABR0KCX9_9EURO|nr:hypothetical protein LTR24_004746 [Lithohypha guttulata]KAK5318889.1 hypothetical protein LTR70_005185 [Exophiala xenobiotica]